MSKLTLPRIGQIRADLEADVDKVVSRKRSSFIRRATEVQRSSLSKRRPSSLSFARPRSLSGSASTPMMSHASASPKGWLPPISPPVRSAKSESSTYSASTAASRVPELPAVADVSAQAMTLIKRHKLEFHEVKWFLSALQNTRPDAENGAMTLATFGKFLQKALDVNSVSDESLRDAYAQCSASSGPLEVDRFLQWYKTNMFSVVAPLTADSTKWKSEEQIRAIAEKFRLRVVEVGVIHKLFEKYDANKSGEIEYDEFEAMMRNLIRVSDATDLPKDRMSRFWNEIDVDGSGAVDFDEFTTWYLKYFTSRNPHGDVLEAFYASYSPDVQRSKHVEDRAALDLDDNSSNRMPRSRHTSRRTVF